MWRSDLCAVRNLLRTKAGRSVLGACAITLVGVGLFAHVLARRTLLRSEVVNAVRADDSGAVLVTLVAIVLLAACLPALVLVPPLLRHELFDGPHVPALLTVPVADRRLLLRALVRTTIFAGLFVAPVAAVVGLGLAARGVVEWWFAAWLSLGAIAWVLPLTGALLVVQIVLTRYATGRRLRALLQWLQVGAGTLAILGLITGFVEGRDIARWFASQAVPTAPTTWLEAIAAVPMLLSGRASGAAWLAPMVAVAFAGLCAALATFGYRASYETWMVGDAARRLAAASPAAKLPRVPWPATPVRSLLRKARLESTRVRGNLVFVVLLAVAQVFAIAVLQAPADSAASGAAVAGQRLLGSWQVLALLLSSLLVIAVVGDDHKQMALLGTAPVDRSAFVRAKVVSLGWPFLLTLGLAATTGVTVGGASIHAALVCFGAGMPILAATLGAILAIGSWPGMVAVHADVPLGNSVRTIVPVTIVAVLGGGAIALRRVAFRWHTEAVAGTGPFAGLAPEFAGAALLVGGWIVGGCLLWAGARVMHRNLERVYGAQPD